MKDKFFFRLIDSLFKAELNGGEFFKIQCVDHIIFQKFQLLSIDDPHCTNLIK